MAIDNIIQDSWQGHSHGEVEDALKALLSQILQDIETAGIPAGGITAEMLATALKNAINNAVPNTRKVNNKALSGDITIGASDINVDSNTTLAQKLAAMEEDIADAGQGGGGGVDPDDEMSSTSENVVQNKVIKAYVDSAVQAVQNAINALVSGQSVTDAIDTFNEVTAFLNGIDTDDPTLANQLLTLSSAISALQTAIAGVYTKSESDGRYVAKNGTDSLMTAAEHTKLAGIAAGAEVNVQSDWSQTNSSAKDFIKNKPTIPDTSTLATKSEVQQGLAGKQDTLTFDNAPTANSNNPVKSGGIKTALDNLLSSITIGQNGNWYVGQTDTGIKAQGPKGNSVVDGDTFDIVNNLYQGGEADALSAEMGKNLGDAIFATPTYDLMPAINAADIIAYNIDQSVNKWVANERTGWKLVNVSQYRGMKLLVKCFHFDSSGQYFFRYVLLTSNTYGSYVNVAYCNGTSIVSNSGENATQYFEVTIPNDCNYIGIYAFSDYNNAGEKYISPVEAVIYGNESINRVEALEDLTEGVDDIKEDWFAVTGEPNDYAIPSNLVGRQMSIGTGNDAGKIFTGSSAPVASLVPKAISASSGSIYHPTDAECFSVDELPNKLLTLKFQSATSPARWAVYVVLYDASHNFIERSDILYFDNSNNFTNTYDFASKPTAKYFALIVYYQSNGSSSDNALNVTYNDGFCEFQRQTFAQESMPDRVAALEAAVDGLSGAGVSKFKLCSWNVGHFALGSSYKTTIDTQAEYEEMRGKWRTKLNEMSPDVLVMSEYSTVFADLATDVEAKDAIFNQFAYRAIGSHPSSTSYMQTAQYTNIPIRNTSEVVYPHTVQAGRYYQVSDLVLGGVTAKLVVTHLDFNQGDNGATYRAEQMQTLLAAFANEPYVIICGDFNNALASEWDVFANAGYVMANHGYLGDISTYPAGDADKAIDNIIVKGFAVSKIEIVDDATLTDHAAIMCDLTLI